MSVQSVLHEMLHGNPARSSRAYYTMMAVQGLIFVNILAIVVQSVASWELAIGDSIFEMIELVSVLIFSVEYLARVYSYTEKGVRARLRYMVTPLAVIDLLAIAPFFLTAIGVDLRMLRVLRLLRLAKLTRYSRAFQVLGRVLTHQKKELLSASFLFMVAALLSATLAYYAENKAQPEVFSSIPAAMWWAVITLTTVGFGDIVPVTALGKLISSGSAIIGVSLFAMLAGILVTGFVEEIRKKDKE